jgi:transposase
MRLNVWLNEQISGNILVMMISLLLGVSSLFMFINNVRNGVTLSTPDKLILVLCVINTPRGVQ